VPMLCGVASHAHNWLVLIDVFRSRRLEPDGRPAIHCAATAMPSPTHPSAVSHVAGAAAGSEALAATGSYALTCCGC